MAKCLSENLGISLTSVSVSVKEVEKEQWKEKVYDRVINIDKNEVL